jgi:hypothetical protein
MNDKRNTYYFAKGIRNEWVINPRTRVKGNELKNKKKRRQFENKLIKDG